MPFIVLIFNLIMKYNTKVYDCSALTRGHVFFLKIFHSYIAKGKLIFENSDYTGGLLLHYNYFIGADFDDTAVEYKWVTNTLVDSIGFLSNYPVTRVTGHCLMWSDMDLLRDYPCSNPLPSICEIPVGTPTAPTGGIFTFLI